MFKKRNTYSRKLKNMRDAKERKRLDSPAPTYPQILPELRREIIIKDFDFGEVEHKIELYRTNRVDCYKMIVDGKLYDKRIGWSRVLEIIRKQFLRVQSIY